MKKSFFRIAGICVLAGALAFINHYIFSLAIVNGDSMYPTLKEGNILAVDRVHRIPERGDIVLIRVPPVEFGAQYYVKRVVGIVGESIHIDYNKNLVYVNGKLLVEPYLNRTQGDPMLPPRWEARKSYNVPIGTVFVMGDNRNYSSDSRDPLLGFVNMEDVVGIAVRK